MRVLVTGSDGMVGSRLVKFLKNNDCTVYEFGEDKDCLLYTSDAADE